MTRRVRVCTHTDTLPRASMLLHMRTSVRFSNYNTSVVHEDESFNMLRLGRWASLGDVRLRNTKFYRPLPRCRCFAADFRCCAVLSSTRAARVSRSPSCAHPYIMNERPQVCEERMADAQDQARREQHGDRAVVIELGEISLHGSDSATRVQAAWRGFLQRQGSAHILRCPICLMLTREVRKWPGGCDHEICESCGLSRLVP